MKSDDVPVGSGILDRLSEIQELDASGMLEILSRFPEQLRLALELGPEPQASFEPDRITSLLICGMGGSAIGGDILTAFAGPDLKIPVIVHRSYSIPNWVDASTLVVACSYSGNTEETLSAFEAGGRRGAPRLCLTSGGTLQMRAEEQQVPVVKIPAGQPPRTAFMFATVPLLAMLLRLGVAPDYAATIERSIAWCQVLVDRYSAEKETARNPAKQLAERLLGRVIIVYGSEGRSACVARRWAAQIAENSKQLAYAASLPEMNHNELVGWKHPAERLRGMAAVLLRDVDDRQRVQQRFEMVGDYLRAQAGDVIECGSEGGNRLERLWSLLLLGDYSSVYLAFLNQEDPTPVGVLDQLKKRLAEK